MIELLGKMGLRANFVPEFSTTEQLEMLSEAAVTAPLCPTFSDYLARGLKQEYDVPYFTYPTPMDFAHTDEWLRKIAEHKRLSHNFYFGNNCMLCQLHQIAFKSLFFCDFLCVYFEDCV